MELFIEISAALGKTDQVNKYSAILEKLEVAYHSAYWDSKNKVYNSGTQTSSIVPLHLDLVPQTVSSQVRASLVNNIQSKKGHLSSGIVGITYLFRVLSEMNRNDVALQVALQLSRKI